MLTRRNKCEPYLRFVFLTGITKEELLPQMSADIDVLGEQITDWKIKE